MKITVIILAIFLVGCDIPKPKPKSSSYIVTDRGLVTTWRYYCDLGMLLNHDGVNVYSEKSVPITCSGYIKLTKLEKQEYEPTNKGE